MKHHHNARDENVRDALVHLDEKGTASGPCYTVPNKNNKAGEYIVPGPDLLWYCDSHDKFRSYGIEIYASVDAHSRRIQWCYVGTSNRRAVSILRQAVTVFKKSDQCSSFDLIEVKKSFLQMHTIVSCIGQESKRNISRR